MSLLSASRLGRSVVSSSSSCVAFSPFSSSSSAAAPAADDGGNVTATLMQHKKRRSRRRQLLSNDNNESIPSLPDFMHRAKVRRQYRNFIRLAHFVDRNHGNDTSVGDDNNKGKTKPATEECRAALDEVRSSYKIGIKKGTDNLSRSMAFNEGERRLRELEAIVGYSSSRNNRKTNTSQPDGDDEQISKERYDADSWINIKDDEDKRGRVGVMWPWERDNGSK